MVTFKEKLKKYTIESQKLENKSSKLNSIKIKKKSFRKAI